MHRGREAQRHRRQQEVGRPAERCQHHGPPPGEPTEPDPQEEQQEERSRCAVAEENEVRHRQPLRSACPVAAKLALNMNMARTPAATTARLGCSGIARIMPGQGPSC
jgi:hypothetical protein